MAWNSVIIVLGVIGERSGWSLLLHDAKHRYQAVDIAQHLYEQDDHEHQEAPIKVVHDTAHTFWRTELSADSVTLFLEIAYTHLCVTRCDGDSENREVEHDVSAFRMHHVV